jgi:hemoglobin
MPLFDDIGGVAGCRKLAEGFYARVAGDPVLRPFFPGKSFRCAIEAFAAFLIQFFGGPAEETQFRHWLSLRESHSRFQIGARERDAWMRLMNATLDDSEMPGPAREAMHAFFERSSAYVIGSDAGEGVLAREIDSRWRVQRSLDEAIAALRAGDDARAIALADPSCGPSRFAALLAAMIASGRESLLDFVSERVSSDAALLRERFRGRILLHAAAAAGNVDLVELFLRLGADPNARDTGGHTPLYSLANECGWGGEGVVRALVRAGAAVDADDGVKHCTPLHMAARRGNSAVAAALLDCGASIEARDSAGDTPLRRSVNCKKAGVARLLLDRGADADSIGSKRMTPRDAARGEPMKQLFRED